MDINLIKRLIKIVEKSEITDFEIQEGDLKIKISKNNRTLQKNSTVPEVNLTPTLQNISVESNPPKIEESKETVEESTNGKLHKVLSPIVGTFYRAPAPDADPYVQVGDNINEGTALCIVEAMKLMNEIESDVSGKIVKILVENGTPVEYNQPLFLIEKD